MKLKLPPALVALLFGVVMWGLDQYLHSATLTFIAEQWVYRMIFGMGIGVGILGLLQFITHQTSIDPHKPGKASILVTEGTYRFSRNPMYLALLIVLLGFGVKLGNMLSFIIIPFFVMYMNRFQITPEEEILREKFGVEFENYTSQVRRWL
jgi:protein-S-isoprenylcysteine O-methyltransferase Ste14